MTTGERNVHGKKEPRSGNSPPIKHVGERCYNRHRSSSSISCSTRTRTAKHPQAQKGRQQRQQSMRDATHSLRMIRAREGLIDPRERERGLEDLLEDDGAKDVEARGAVARCDLCRVVDAVAGEPGRGGEVEELEEGRGEPVGGERREDRQERVGEGGEERGRGGVVDWVGVEERVLVLPVGGCGRGGDVVVAREHVWTGRQDND